MLSNEQQHRAPTSQYSRVANRDITSPIAAFNYAEDGPDLKTYAAAQGEDTDAILSDLGYSAEQLTELRDKGAIF